MKTLAIYFILAASVIADTLPELVAQAKADGVGPNLVDIAKHLNAPRYTTTATTNSVAKPAELITIESSILAELVATGIDPTAAVVGGWTYIIDQLDSAFESAPDSDSKQAVLKSSVLLLAGYEQLKTIKPEGDTIDADFGQPTATVVGQVRVANPSLAAEHLGQPVTISDLR